MDRARIEKVQKKLEVDCLIIDNPVDLYYLTGLVMSVGRMVIFSDRAILFVDSRYIEKAKNEAPCEAQLIDAFPKSLEKVHRVGFDSAFVTWDGFQSMKQKVVGKEWVPLSAPLQRVRVIKEKKEIDALRRAAQLTWEGFQHVSSLLKEGVAEEELALEFEFFCRKKGASKLSFSPIIAFGENSAFPHYRAGKVRLKKNQIVLFDLGAVVDGYAGDMTRVVFFGAPDPQLKKDYLLLKKVQAGAVSMVRPGVRFGDLDKHVREELKKEGVEALFTHGLSHGVGLDVHEFPSLRKESGDPELRLAPGMVFTIEPGLYRPGLGGVRYEDTVLVTEAGVENFFPSAYCEQ